MAEGASYGIIGLEIFVEAAVSCEDPGGEAGFSTNGIKEAPVDLVKALMDVNGPPDVWDIGNMAML